MDFINGINLSRQDFARLTTVFLFFCGLFDENFFPAMTPSHVKEHHYRRSVSP